MTYKWNPAEAGNYAKAFSAYLTEEFFKSQNRISGHEILRFSDIKQLNLFIIKNLYAKWQEESLKLQSPFFDFNSPDVKEALDLFMNVLSRNISVGKEAFEGLLTKATLETLQLCMEPAAYFETAFRNLPDFKLTPGWLQENMKYYSVCQQVLSGLETALAGKEIYANEAISMLKQVEPGGDEPGRFAILNELDSIKPLLLKKEEPGKSFFEDLLKEHISKPGVETEIRTMESRVNQLQKEHASVTVAVPVGEAVTTKPENLRLNERLLNGNKTLNEKITTDAKSLLDVHQKRKIASLKEGISLNQRYLFINNLFGGDHKAFALALDELEQFNDLATARRHAEYELSRKYNWEKATDEAGEFYAHLERKFA